MRIHRTALNAAIAHAHESSPRECCGLLLAAGVGATDRALRAENEERERPEQAYRLGRRAHLQAVRLECTGQARITGYYHSHPLGPAAPSRQDAERAVPDATYLIVGLAEDSPGHAAWRWTGERFVREPLEVTEDVNADSDPAAQDQRRAAAL